MRRIVAVALATAVLVLSPTVAAVADESDQLNTGTLTYTGTYTYGSGGSQEIPPQTLNCVDGVCIMPWFPEIGDIVFTDGVAIIDVPNQPIDCASNGSGRGYTGELALADGKLTGYIEMRARDLAECGYEGTVLPAERDTLDLTLAQGRECFIDASCQPMTADEALAESGGTFMPGARNDIPLPAGGDRAFTAPTYLSQIATYDDLTSMDPMFEEALAEELPLPLWVLWVGVVTLLLFVLVVFPVGWGGVSLNRLVDRVRAASRARRGVEVDSAETGLRGWRWAAGGVAAAALVTTFTDPQVAFDLASVRVFLTHLVVFGLSVLGGWALAAALLRAKDREATPTVRFSPFTLLAVVAAVLLTRAFEFEPTIVYGVVGAIAYSGAINPKRNGRLALLGLAWAFVLGLLAWFVYGSMDAGNAALVPVREFFSALALAGIGMVPFALLPVPGFPGASIWRWRKFIWIPVFLLTLTVWVFVFLPLPELSIATFESLPMRVASDIGAWFAVSVLASVVGIVLLIVSASLRGADKRRARKAEATAPAAEPVEAPVA